VLGRLHKIGAKVYCEMFVSFSIKKLYIFKMFLVLLALTLSFEVNGLEDDLKECFLENFTLMDRDGRKKVLFIVEKRR
jgi:hypothetical protein